ncbi:MAG: HAMP domain-containing sensor histidine kinase [bacterium]
METSKPSEVVAAAAAGALNANNEEQLRSVNETVYKHSFELVTKNKTLTLLGQLYEIATLALEDKEMAARMVAVIQKEFEFEVVGMLAYNQADNTLAPLAFAVSGQIEMVKAASERQLMDREFGKVTQFVYIEKAIVNKEMVYTESVPTFLAPIASIRSSFVYPLMVNDKVLGVLVLSLNRVQSDIVAYEQEAMNSFAGVIAIALDKVFLYEALGRANVQLAALDKQKSEFLSIASHQLRTPLTAIKWSASAILEKTYGEVPPDLRAPIQTIFDESVLMATFINDYLNISRIEQGRMEYHFAPIDMTETLQTVVSEMHPGVVAKGLTFEATIASEKMMVWGDAGKLIQIFTNIIDNAVKYTPSGSITLSAKKVGSDTVRVEIHDTGIGITQETLHTLFDKFARGKNANDVNSAGSGLGLFVARTFVEAHKGRVWPESAGEGKGTTFVIELPLLVQK